MHGSLHSLLVQVKSKFLPSPLFVSRASLISVSLAFRPSSRASTVNAAVGSWPSGSTVSFAPTVVPKILNATQRNSIFQVFGMT